MYPHIDHLGFKCIITLFMFLEFISRHAYRDAKLKLLKKSKLS